MEPLDLTQAPPRSPRDMLDGLAMLPRTIDKMRACLPGGNPGSYHVDGMSARMLSIVKVDPAALQDAVARAASEQDVVAWMRANADTGAYPEATRAMLTRSISDIPPERQAEFAKKYPHHAAAPSTKLADIIDHDDSVTFWKSGAKGSVVP